MSYNFISNRLNLDIIKSMLSEFIPNKGINELVDMIYAWSKDTTIQPLMCSDGNTITNIYGLYADIASSTIDSSIVKINLNTALLSQELVEGQFLMTYNANLKGLNFELTFITRSYNSSLVLLKKLNKLERDIAAIAMPKFDTVRISLNPNSGYISVFNLLKEINSLVGMR